MSGVRLQCQRVGGCQLCRCACLCGRPRCKHRPVFVGICRGRLRGPGYFGGRALFHEIRRRRQDERRTVYLRLGQHLERGQLLSRLHGRGSGGGGIHPYGNGSHLFFLRNVGRRDRPRRLFRGRREIRSAQHAPQQFLWIYGRHVDGLSSRVGRCSPHPLEIRQQEFLERDIAHAAHFIGEPPLLHRRGVCWQIRFRCHRRLQGIAGKRDECAGSSDRLYGDCFTQLRDAAVDHSRIRREIGRPSRGLL